MLIAEDLLLLLTDDESGKAKGSTPVDLGLAGALLADLALLQRVGIGEDGKHVKKGRLVVADASPTGDTLLDGALGRLARYVGKRPDKAVGALTKETRRAVYLRLAARGLVRQHESKLFGITLRTTWPAQERSHEQVLRAHLALCVGSGRTPTERDAALLAILGAIGRLDIVAGGAQTTLTRKDIRRANREMSERSWVSAAVRDAVKRASAGATTAGASVAASTAAMGS
ncbi:MAG TPA: GPP34 family phosphoprotein [Nocardioidaceae bacterium]|nr:GPP34 family phosphoprotein [Nocardioidaceae bacterium]